MSSSHDNLSILRARAHESRFESMHDLREATKAEVRKVVVGQDQAVELFLVAALSHGHVLVEGPPGSAKTLLARAMAHVLGSSFKRIQFTPDTTPTHIIGEQILKAGEHVFLPGPIFANVVLADEINRTPPRTQAALLEAMQEHHVTVDGRTHRLPDPFLVIATQNPFEHEGIYSLPESQLDRFLFKIYLEYTDSQSEVEMLTLPHLGIAPDMLGEIRPLLGVRAWTRLAARSTPPRRPTRCCATSSESSAPRATSRGSSWVQAHARRSTFSPPRRRTRASRAGRRSPSRTSARSRPTCSGTA